MGGCINSSQAYFLCLSLLLQFPLWFSLIFLFLDSINTLSLASIIVPIKCCPSKICIGENFLLLFRGFRLLLCGNVGWLVRAISFSNCPLQSTHFINGATLSNPMRVETVSVSLISHLSTLSWDMTDQTGWGGREMFYFTLTTFYIDFVSSSHYLIHLALSPFTDVKCIYFLNCLFLFPSINFSLLPNLPLHTPFSSIIVLFILLSPHPVSSPFSLYSRCYCLGGGGKVLI